MGEQQEHNPLQGTTRDPGMLVLGTAVAVVCVLVAMALWAMFGQQVFAEAASRAWALCF